MTGSINQKNHPFSTNWKISTTDFDKYKYDSSVFLNPTEGPEFGTVTLPTDTFGQFSNGTPVYGPSNNDVVAEWSEFSNVKKEPSDYSGSELLSTQTEAHKASGEMAKAGAKTTEVIGQVVGFLAKLITLFV